MQLIITVEGSDNLCVLDLPHDSEVELLAQMVQAEVGIPLNQQEIEFEGTVLQYGVSLAQYGITDGTPLIVRRKTTANTNNLIPPQQQQPHNQHQPNQQYNNLQQIPSDITPEGLLSLANSNPMLLRQLQQSDPELGECLASGDLGRVRMHMMKKFAERHKQAFQRNQELQAFAADPMNPELQRKIEEQIQQENIQENMAFAIENLPESFGRVTMLYVDIQVNSHPVKAFVDSGAQSTIMSMRCAEACGILRLIDKRFAGEARGVGTAKIIGRVHIAQMKFGNSFFPISITVLEDNKVDFLFGLDTLRRYRCAIDLAKNVLRIDGVNGPEEIAFLPESELPDSAKGNYEEAQDPAMKTG